MTQLPRWESPGYACWLLFSFPSSYVCFVALSGCLCACTYLSQAVYTAYANVVAMVTASVVVMVTASTVAMVTALYFTMVTSCYVGVIQGHEHSIRGLWKDLHHLQQTNVASRLLPVIGCEQQWACPVAEGRVSQPGREQETGAGNGV